MRAKISDQALVDQALFGADALHIENAFWGISKADKLNTDEYTIFTLLSKNLKLLPFENYLNRYKLSQQKNSRTAIELSGE